MNGQTSLIQKNIDYGLLIARMKKLILSGEIKKDYYQILANKNIWAKFTPEQALEWARLTQIIGKTDLALEILEWINTQFPDFVHAWLEHFIEYGRPSLACDLVEEWRTFLADRFILTLINRKIISNKDFVYRSIEDTDFIDETDLKQKRPVEMKPNTCKALLKAYEKWMQKKIKDPISEDYTTHRNLILRQIRRFEKYLLEEENEYQPFLWSRGG